MTDHDYQEVWRLRDRHVAKLLTHLGGDSVAPVLQTAIKKSYSMFAEDVIENLRIENNSEESDDTNERDQRG